MLTDTLGEKGDTYLAVLRKLKSLFCDRNLTQASCKAFYASSPAALVQQKTLDSAAQDPPRGWRIGQASTQ